MTLHQGFDVNVISSVSHADQDSWNHMAGGRSFASYAWYHFCETVLEKYTPFHMMLSHQGDTIARSTFWLAPEELLPVSNRPVRALLQTMIRRWPLFICRSPLANVSGLILPEPPLRDDAVQVLSREAENISRKYHTSFIVFDYLEQKDDPISWPPGYARFSIFDPSTYLDIQWPDMKSYLAHLSSSARKDYRRHNNRAADQGIKIAFHDSVTDLERSLELIRNVEKHHHSPPHPLTPKVLKYAHMVDSKWITAHIDDQLVGCGMLMGDGSTQFLALLGMDYSVNYVYFQLFYAAIQNAIESGVKLLYGGSGAYDFKQHFGFQVKSDNHLIYRPANRGLRWLVKGFGG